MTDYRFTLQKYTRGSKVTCPHCGKKYCFVRYIDTQGEITFPDYVGRCDHEMSCKYHYKPSDYFKDSGMSLEQVSCYDKPVMQPGPSLSKPISLIDDNLMKRSLTGFEINPLHIFLSGIFGTEETDRIFRLYAVGTSKKWNGSTVYWQIDSQNRVRTGKIMLYDSHTGHRVKEPRSYVSWVHTELKMESYNLKQCLFGENLLGIYPNKTVAIVESEKSALIATHYMPDFIWLATGGMHGCFKSEVVSVLKNRQVILCPDLGAFDTWKAKVPLLSTICSRVVLSEILEQNATSEQREKGLDIADFFLMDSTPFSILQKMLKRNPNLQHLIDVFDLELVDER